MGSLLATAVGAVSTSVGPWNPGAPGELAAAYRLAEQRRSIAEAIDDRFGVELHRPIDLDAQQWWNSESTAGRVVEPGFRRFDWVYGSGQFTWAGLWTVSDPPPEVHEDLANAWELFPRPVSRWKLPVRSGGRIVEIHHPVDWVELVSAHPAEARPGQECWELPGRNQRNAEVAELLAVPHQHAARGRVGRHLVPDWRRVAAHYDGVHLSWAGFLTAEGYVSDLGDGDVAVLRYWFSERTHWLADVFGEPEPLAAPDPDSNIESSLGVDVRSDDARRSQDRIALLAQLDR